jgi:hypothetical protein
LTDIGPGGGPGPEAERQPPALRPVGRPGPGGAVASGEAPGRQLKRDSRVALDVCDSGPLRAAGARVVGSAVVIIIVGRVPGVDPGQTPLSVDPEDVAAERS